MAPSLQGPVAAMRFVNAFQLIMAFFYQFDQRMWPKDTVIGRLVGFLSIGSVLCPTTASIDTFGTVFITMVTFCIIFQIFLWASLYTFLKWSKVDFLTTLIISTLITLFAPWILNILSAGLAWCVYCIHVQQYVEVAVVGLVLGLCAHVMMFFVNLYFINATLLYKPQIYFLMYMKYVVLYSVCSCISLFITTLGGLLGSSLIEYFNLIPGIVVSFVASRPYAWGERSILVSSQALAVVLVISSIVMPTMAIFNTGYAEVVVVILLVVLFIGTGFFTQLHERTVEKIKCQLDNLTDEPRLDECIAEIPYQQLMNMLKVGFETGHRLCHSWQLFDLAFLKYPHDVDIVILFARYGAIYPNESRVLQATTRKLRVLKKGSIFTKNILFQVNALLQHRERGLSKRIQKALTKIKDKTEKCRAHMRYIWECVLRGNVRELEKLTTQLRRNEDEIVREYHQLMLMYPNNPHVASAYSTFMLEIMCNDAEATEAERTYVMLRSGTRTQVEREYQYAMEHIPTLPTEEEHMKMSRISRDNEGDMIASSTSMSSVGPDSNAQERADINTQKKYVASLMNTVRPPTTIYGPFIIVILMLLLIPFSCIPVMIYVRNQLRASQQLARSMEHVAKLEVYVSHLIYHTWQYAFAKAGYVGTLKETFDKVYRNQIPNYYLEDDREALLRCASEVGNSLREINTIASSVGLATGFEESIDMVVSRKLTMLDYHRPKEPHKMQVSLGHYTSYLTATAVQIANSDNIFDYPGFWTVIRNGKEFFDQCEFFTTRVIKAIQTDMMNRQSYLSRVLPSAYIALFLVILIILGWLVYRLDQEKKAVFRSFKSLPKSTLSAVIQQLNEKMGRRDYKEEHVSNSQEDSALRVFSATTETGFGGFTRRWVFLMLVGLYFIIGGCYLLIVSWRSSELISKFSKITPLYTDIVKIHTKFMTSLVLLERVVMTTIPSLYEKYSFTEEYENCLEAALHCLLDTTNDAHVLLFGSEATGSEGASIIGDSIVRLVTASSDLSLDNLPEHDIEFLDVSSYQTGMEFIARMINYMALNLKTNYRVDPVALYTIDASEYQLVSVWLLQISHQKFVAPALDYLDASVSDLGDQFDGRLIPVIVVFVIIFMICGICLVPVFVRSGEVAKHALSLLLFCDPAIVLQSKAILRVLSNDFSVPEADENDERDSFYETIASNLLDGVVFMSNDLTILSVNAAAGEVIGQSPESMLGKNLKKLFTPSSKDDTKLCEFLQYIDSMMNNMMPPSIDTEIEILKNDNDAVLKVSLSAISASSELQLTTINAEGISVFVLILKDITRMIATAEILEEANKKNENLMSMVLPLQVVREFQTGKYDLSFMVPSVSIAVVNIIDFTGWCEQQTPVRVMEVLNKLFMGYEAIIAKYSKLTRVKIFGDTYMCAGGIFDEVNQQEEHCKQIVSFCIDALEMVRGLNAEFGENLRVKIGCNTGGRVVAGVLGVNTKPVFDLIGDNVNLAYLMEKTGVPNYVHISDAVYQMIYDQEYIIKEYDDVESKGKVYHTYLISS